MKKLSFLLLLFSSHLAFSQSSGIEFTTDKWKEILKRAREENKLIFFDAYTTWCGPCLRLQSQVFPNKAVGDYYNKNFINVKFDMEKGEGIALSKKFAVQVYPTLLFIDPKTEKVIHHSVGFKNPEQLLLLGEQSLNRSNL